MHDKLNLLKDILRQMDTVAVAYSGGVDSSFVLKVAHDVLGDQVIALTADSASLPREELQEALSFAASLPVRHVCLDPAEMADPSYLANTSDRCYFCKSHTYDSFLSYAAQHGCRYIVDGNNADDAQDHRPGRRAAAERGVRSPLQEAGLTKAEIRQLAREMGLAVWDKPAAACLSSRIPYGTPVTAEALAQIEASETYLRGCGFRQLRVRHHGQVARIELEPADFPRALDLRDEIVARLKGIGYLYVALDLAGYRSGSMNEVLEGHERAAIDLIA